MCVYVWFGGIYAVWCLKKKSQGDISLKGGWKGHAPPLVCVKGCEYLSSEGLHGKSRLDDFIFWSPPLHLWPIKWHDWQICHTFSALLLTYSYLCPLFLSSLVFLFLFFKLLLWWSWLFFLKFDLPVMCTFKHHMLPQRPLSKWHFSPPSHFFNE